MKKLLLILFTASITIYSYGQDASWLTDLQVAKDLAQETDKMILMSFSGSDWCASCIKLDRELFQTEDFQSFAEKNLILLKVDFPAKKANKLSDEQVAHNENLASRYNKKGEFPSVYIVNERGSIQSKMDYPQSSTADYIKEINRLIAE